MEIIAGFARGIQLQVPPGDAVRPTAVRARKALFDSLGNFSGMRIADLCAGAGGLGLEAASRGASEVVFVEKNAGHCRMLERNIRAVQKTGTACQFSIVNASVQELTRWCKGRFDIIFADPPYADSAAIFASMMERSPLLSATGGMLVWEIPDTPGAKGAFLQRGGRFRKYGASEFLLLKLNTNTTGSEGNA